MIVISITNRAWKTVQLLIGQYYADTSVKTMKKIFMWSHVTENLNMQDFGNILLYKRAMTICKSWVRNEWMMEKIISYLQEVSEKE